MGASAALTPTSANAAKATAVVRIKALRMECSNSLIRQTLSFPLGPLCGRAREARWRERGQSAAEGWRGEPRRVFPLACNWSVGPAPTASCSMSPPALRIRSASWSPVTDPLLEPFRLKQLQLRNRIFSSAHEPAYSDRGMPTERYRLYHVERRGAASA